jgi:hypothetical protein
MLTSHTRWSSRLLGLCVVLASSASGAAITVNGVCQVGNCSSPDVVGFGELITTPFDFTYTLANTDRYQISGRMSSFNAGGTSFAAPVQFEMGMLEMLPALHLSLTP